MSDTRFVPEMCNSFSNGHLSIKFSMTSGLSVSIGVMILMKGLSSFLKKECLGKLMLVHRIASLDMLRNVLLARESWQS